LVVVFVDGEKPRRVSECFKFAEVRTRLLNPSLRRNECAGRHPTTKRQQNRENGGRTHCREFEEFQKELA
jgi:hypothetical protein